MSDHRRTIEFMRARGYPEDKIAATIRDFEEHEAELREQIERDADDERDDVQPAATRQQPGQPQRRQAADQAPGQDPSVRLGAETVAKTCEGKITDFKDTEELADCFLEKTGPWIFWGNQWWQYADRHYRKVPSYEFKPMVRRHLLEQKTQITKSAKVSVSVTGELVANTIATVEAKTLRPSDQPMPALKGQGDRDLLPLGNGLLDLDTLELLPHTPDFFDITLLPYDYDPGAACPRFLASLQRSFTGTADADGLIALVQEWFGYVLSRSLEAQKFLILYGPPGTGKTTLLSPLEAMLGRDNVSFVDLPSFSHEFGLAPTFGRKVNIAGDVGKVSTVNEGLLKKYADGSGITINEKGQPIMNVKPTAKLVFATNELPRFEDKTGAVYRRLLMVPMERVVTPDEKNTQLATPDWWSQSGEMPGVLNWALAGLARLKKNGFQFTIPPSVTAAIDRYRLDNDLDRRFLVENFEADANGYVTTDRLYQQYQEWAKENGHKGVSNRTNLYKTLLATFPTAHKGPKKVPGGKVPQAWHGIKEKSGL
jgi:P4 family phage/plasmid primase-like protien